MADIFDLGAFGGFWYSFSDIFFIFQQVGNLETYRPFFSDVATLSLCKLISAVFCDFFWLYFFI